jgi:hypothetical protein
MDTGAQFFDIDSLLVDVFFACVRKSCRMLASHRKFAKKGWKNAIPL